MLGDNGLSIFGNTQTEDTLKALAGMGEGRTYYVNNASGSATADGLSWASAVEQVDEAITLSEASRILGAAGDDYTRNTIVIQGTNTYYDELASDAGNFANMIGLGTGANNYSVGQVRIGAGTASNSVVDAASHEGGFWYNIQFSFGGNSKYGWKLSNWAYCSQWHDCVWMHGATGTSSMAFYAARMTGCVFDGCTFTSNSAGVPPTYGFKVDDQFYDTLIQNCHFKIGSTALMYVGGYGTGSTVKNNTFSPVSDATCTYGFQDASATGYAVLAGNYFAVTCLTNDISRTVNQRTIGNMTSGTGTFVSS